MGKQTAVRLSDETYDRLKKLVEKGGGTVSYYIREALERGLPGLETTDKEKEKEKEKSKDKSKKKKKACKKKKST